MQVIEVVIEPPCKSGMDLALAAGAFGQRVTLVFAGGGAST